MKKKEGVMEPLEAALKPEQEIKKQQREVSEHKKQYRDLKLNYLRDKAALKDQAKKDLEERKQQYTVDKLSIEQPLKAEKYRLKIQKKNRNRALNEAPRRGILEEVGNATTHGVGAILGLVCLGLMIAKANDAWSLTAAIIYGSCFFLQMLFSCLYHSFRCGSTVKRIFRRFDYSSIYLAIGGTFAPLWLIYMRTKMWGGRRLNRLHLRPMGPHRLRHHFCRCLWTRKSSLAPLHFVFCDWLERYLVLPLLDSRGYPFAHLGNHRRIRLYPWHDSLRFVKEETRRPFHLALLRFSRCHPHVDGPLSLRFLNRLPDCHAFLFEACFFPFLCFCSP